MSSKVPNPAEIQKEIDQFLKQKYGDRVVTQNPDILHPPEQGQPGEDQTANINFDLKPEELEAYLNQYIINQELAIEVLATKICTHFNRMKLETRGNMDELVGNIKSNILMIGPTGVGKTYLVRLIAKKIGVPFVKGDATKFSETGYVGGDVEDLIRDLVREAGGNIKLAEYGIVYLDEIDKIAATSHTYGPDVSRTGVQRNLLKLMEESDVDLKTPHDLAAQMEAAMEAQRTGKIKRKKINTKNILFVMSGSFSGMVDIIKKRLNQHAIGFGSHPTIGTDGGDVDYLALAKSEDFITYGFESEFIGRLPVQVRLNELDAESLYQILKSPQSTVILGKKRDFQAYGIELNFEDDALRQMAELGYHEKTGARGLVTAAEKILLKYEKKLPSTTIKSFTVTSTMVLTPEKELDILLNRHSMKQFQKDFLASTGIVITFTPGAQKVILDKAKQKKSTFQAICRELFADYEYGLKLIDIPEFTIDEKVLENPQGQLEALIKQTYHSK
ncbi:AAA family ATPase [candidate division KSB1 bacterium]|nr:AAA family ATPase [candidate division KSB1 bacterium]